MKKRGKLEIIRDILFIIKESHSPVRITPLLRRSNISSSRFREYYSDLIEKQFIKELNVGGNKTVSISEKGLRFLEKYKAIVSFIDEFDL